MRNLIGLASLLVSSSIAQEEDVWNHEYIEALFDAYDADHSGYLDLKEIATADEYWEFFEWDDDTNDSIGKFLSSQGWTLTPEALYGFYWECEQDFDCF